MFEDRRTSAKSIAEQPGISRERVLFIIHEDLDIRKLSAKWIPKCLNADQKRQPCRSSEQHLELYFADAIQMISCRDWWPWTRPCYIAMTWRESNIKWSVGITAYPAANIPSAKFGGKFIASIFCDQDSILLFVYLPKSQNIKAECYASLLVQLKHILKEKRRGKFTKVNLFLHDKAPSHRHL